MCDVADNHLVGWAYWQFKNYADPTTVAGTRSEGFYNSDGSLIDWKVKALARSYLMYTQGVITSLKFDTTTSKLSASFTVNTDIQEPTVIYQSSEYWCTQVDGCQCEYSRAGVSLSAETFTEIEYVDKNYTSFTIVDTSLNGETIDIKCGPATAQVKLITA